VSHYWFPDNTVLCNFASVHSLNLLEAFLDGRGRWVEAVAYEAHESAHVYRDLHQLGWLGPPIEITDPRAIRTIEAIRRAAFAGDAAKATQHLGEAQTCWLICEDPEYSDATWITDDRQAFDYAKRRGIRTLDTYDLVSEAVSRTDVTRAAGFALLQDMSATGRHVRLPGNQWEL
jgi:hypothetical protein